MKKTVSVAVAAVLSFLLLLGALAAVSADESVIDIIITAGTTQAFSDEPVPDADLELILRAGAAAESAINQQPWFFAVAKDPEIMKKLSGSGAGFTPPAGAPPAGAPSGMPTGGPGVMGSSKAGLGDSPVAIIIYMDENTSSPNASFDCGLATQNMYIAASSLGYGVKIVSSPTMTLNGSEHDSFCEMLGVDPSMRAVAVLLIGKPDTSVDITTGASPRYDLGEKSNIR